MNMLPVDHAVAAALQGDAVTLQKLLDANAGLVFARNMFGASAAHAAHFRGNTAISHLLEANGWQLDGFLAAELGRLEALSAAIAEDDEFATRFDGAGSTALHGALYWGQLEAAEILLDAAADPNAKSRDTFLKIPPLGSAVATTPGIPQPSDDEDRVLGLVRLLLEHGADVNARRRDGMTALHTAGFRGLARVAQELLDAGADASIAATDGAHAGQTAADVAVAQGHLVLAADLDVPGAAVAPPYGS